MYKAYALLGVDYLESVALLRTMLGGLVFHAVLSFQRALISV